MFGLDQIGYTTGNITNGGTSRTIASVESADVGLNSTGTFTQVVVNRSSGITTPASSVDYIFLTDRNSSSFAGAIVTSTITNGCIDTGLTRNVGVASSFYNNITAQTVYGYILNTSNTAANTLDARIHS